MKKSTVVIQLSALLAVALFSGCTNNSNLKPQSYKYQTYPQNPNYAIIKPSKDKEFSEENLASMIKELEGRPYVWAEEGPYCFDCSGYLYYMFGKMGVDIPRVAREQIKHGQPIAFEDMKFGDFVFFDTTKNKSGKITHVGMYLKDGWFTHASSSHRQITYSNFNTDPYYRSRFMGARRYYEKNGNKYAILKPKMQNEFTQMLASNTKTNVDIQIKPTTMLASNFKTTNNTTNIKFTETKITQEPTNVGEVAYEDLEKAGAGGNLASNDYKIKEEKIVIKSTEDINNQPIQTINLNAVKKTKDVVPAEKIAQVETKVENTTPDTTIAKVETNVDSTVTPTEKIAQVDTEVEEMFPADKTLQTETKIEKVDTATNVAKLEVEPSNKNSSYYVQVGKFQNKPDASFLNKIKAQGYAYTIMPISENGKIASKILIGPFDDTEAYGKLNAVKENIIKEAFVTKIDS
ncbi:MAG: NlpC/P60 family protein [Sulfurovaceae bacterium]|nr:NlpC/P60 family protein [Sulfurovaceae bacterium]MDD5548569.1 NlpC/P60 family protein [Sulfurovaceae bacterium]